VPIILTNQTTSSRGGIQRYVVRLARELSRSRGRVVIVEPTALDEAEGTDGIIYRRFRAGGRLGELLNGFFAYMRCVLAERGDFTLASIWFPSGLIAAVLPRFLRGPLAITVHGTEVAPERGGIRRALLRYTLRRADAVFAVSTFVQGLVAKVEPRANVVLIHSGVDVVGAHGVRASRPTLLSVGRLVARKGFDRTIEALPEILSALPDAVYEIVGDGPQRSELEELVARLKLTDSVRFLGAVDDDALRAAYARAWCFALPCRRIGSDVEGFGLVYLEAAVAGLPSIGGRYSGAEDAIVHEETGLLVDGNDAAAIAAAAIRLLGDPAYAARLGTRGAQRAEADFSWAETGRKVTETMTKLSAARA